MGDDWCPLGGRCAQPGCWVDVHNRCEVHNCPMISKEVLGLIRQELRNTHMSAVGNWKARVAELQRHVDALDDKYRPLQDFYEAHQHDELGADRVNELSARVAELEVERYEFETRVGALERAKTPRPVGSVKRDAAPKFLGWCSVAGQWVTVWWDDGWRDADGLRYPTHLLPVPPEPDQSGEGGS